MKKKQSSSRMMIRALMVMGSILVPVSAIPPDTTLATQDGRILAPTIKRVSSGFEETAAMDAAGLFDAFNVNLLSQVPVADFSGDSQRGSDVWGYVSPSGREYAILGMSHGTGFVDVTDPLNPLVLGEIPNLSPGCTSQDMAVWDQYCYSVSDCGGSGNLQTIDLSLIDEGTITHVHTLTENGFARAHNVFVNPDSGYGYLCGANAPTSGLIALSLADPAAPTMIGVWTDHRVHDVYVMNYADCPYSGRSGPCEIAFAFVGGAGTSIIDVTDKTAITTITNFAHPNLAFSHQGWITEDHKHLLIGDEGDESGFGLSTTTYIYNVEDLENPTFVTSFTNGLASIDHNMMVRGNYVFQANYSSGLRIWDISNIHSPVEVGYFDTLPANDFTSFSGAWGVYAALPSGVILVSNDTADGLFVLDAFPAVGCQQDSHCNDKNPCTEDICDAKGACENTTLPPTTFCDDGNVCTFSGECDAFGECVSTDYNTVSCTDNGPCGPGICDLDAGLCFCVECVHVLPALPEPEIYPKNRYLSMIPGNPGVEAAIRVVLSDLPPQFSDKIGMELWVGDPIELCENAGESTPPTGGCSSAPGQPSRTFLAAPLQDTPLFRDWSADGQIEVFGPAVVPGGKYTAQTIGLGCYLAAVSRYSQPLAIDTSIYGDSVKDCQAMPCPPPNGLVEIVDVLAILNKFQNLEIGPRKVRMDLEPHNPDHVVGIADAIHTLFGFLQRDYPFEGP